MPEPKAEPPDPPISLNLTKLVEFFEPRVEQKVAERLERRQSKLFGLLATGATILIGALSAGMYTFLESQIEQKVESEYREKTEKTERELNNTLAFLRITTAAAGLSDVRDVASQAKYLRGLLAAVVDDRAQSGWRVNIHFHDDLRTIVAFFTRHDSLDPQVDYLHNQFKEHLPLDPKIAASMMPHYARRVLSATPIDFDGDDYVAYKVYAKAGDERMGLLYNMLIESKRETKRRDEVIEIFAHIGKLQDDDKQWLIDEVAKIKNTDSTPVGMKKVVENLDKEYKKEIGLLKGEMKSKAITQRK